MPVYVNNEQDKKEVTDELIKTVQKAVDEAFKIEKVSPAKEVSITFIDNHYIRDLNREYRNQDRVTDVLSFAMDEQGEEEPDITGAETEEVLGDIFISLEMAQSQSVEYDHSFMREVVYLAIHGLLHLLGYDHMNEEDKVIMRKHEEIIMNAVNLTR